MTLTKLAASALMEPLKQQQQQQQQQQQEAAAPAEQTTTNHHWPRVEEPSTEPKSDSGETIELGPPNPAAREKHLSSFQFANQQQQRDSQYMSHDNGTFKHSPVNSISSGTNPNEQQQQTNTFRSLIEHQFPVGLPDPAGAYSSGADGGGPKLAKSDNCQDSRSNSTQFQVTYSACGADDDDDEGLALGSLESTEKRPESLRQRLSRWSLVTMKVLAAIIILDLIIYLWPMDEPQVETKVAPPRPRPRFEGPWALNERLDSSELLFADQFHAPESMAWTSDKRAFFTGVEGGFILFVEPYEERWTLVARLNARNSVRDLTAAGSHQQQQQNGTRTTKYAPFCRRDVELYGPRAEFEPRLVRISRCSRPLGMRLSPDNSHLYASDPLSGIYRIDLLSGAQPGNSSGGGNESVQLPAATKYQVSKLLHLDGVEPGHRQKRNSPASPGDDVLFADDIAVDWATSGGGDNSTTSSDTIYLTDCSRRLTLRYLFRLMAENDDSGRVLQFDTGSGKLAALESVVPVQTPDGGWDQRRLSFPNGLELSANGSALLVSDLNNRRILMHHLRGPLAGQSRHLLWVSGYPDNVRRGLDLADGRATYWGACGCAVSDGSFELAEFFNDYPRTKRLLLKAVYFVGWSVELAGELLDSTALRDGGLMIKAAWLKHDPYCTHGLVFQFTEEGEVLRSLHAPHFGSMFKLISEAHEVPYLGPAATAAESGDDDDDDKPTTTGAPADEDDQAEEVSSRGNSTSGTSKQSALYLGSVYYPYLGRLKLNTL